MPLQRERGDPASEFIDVRRVFVDSADRARGTVSDYEFMLPRAISNVISIELTAFALPSSMTPSFSAGVNDAIDFTLTQGAVTKFFSFRMPSNSFSYQNIACPYLDYLRILEQSLNRAFITDPDFGSAAASPAIFVTAPDPEEKTQIYCYGADAVFLFDTGPNREQSAYQQLGFARADYAFTGSALLGPFPALLEPSQQVEISLDEVPNIQPLAVVYNSSLKYYAQTQNELSARLRLIDNDPPRVLDRLTVRIRVDGKPIENAFKNEHSLSFSVFCFTHVDGPVPAWLKQFNAI
jgi:hypothetical protein